MKCFIRTGNGSRRAWRGAAAFALALCLLLSAVPTALGGSSVGSTPASVKPNLFNKTYIMLEAPIVFSKGATYGSGATVSPSAGTVWQLVSENYYTSSEDGQEYYGVYYQNARYNVLVSDADPYIMSAGDLITFITGTLWTQPSFTTLKKEMGLVGDIRVHGLQYALSQLGYYSGALDGDYGDQTAAAVTSFQRKNGLAVDGRAGPITQAALYAIAAGGSAGGGSSGGSSGGSTTTSGTLRTTVSVNLRKSSSKQSARLAVVPKSTTLAYTATALKSGVTWYKVNYNSLTGWLMGTFVNAGGSSGGGGSSSSPAIGTVTITKPGTRVRVSPNGAKSGTLLAKNSVVSLISTPVTAGGYTWYNIRTAAGLVGYVRGDCATATMGGASGVTPSASKTFVRLPAKTALFTTQTRPSSGIVNVAAGTVLQMVSPTTYATGGVTYCSLYYNNVKYNAEYDDVSDGVMSASELAEYVQALWGAKLSGSLKQELDLVGDVRVYAMQLALSNLGFYTGALDGTFGGGSASAVRNFQRKHGLEVDGACGAQTWAKLTSLVSGTSAGGGGTGGGTGTVVEDFGTVNSVEKATWTAVDGGSVSLFKKGTNATVMDVATGKVFTVYRWSGGSHADCVPYAEADTRVMCDIVNCPYTSSRPTSSQLAKIKADNNNYTWPDFNNAFGVGRDIGSAWDRRAALLNVGGRVFCVSIYGYPHGFNGTDSFASSKFPNGQLFYAQNNYYGMLCVHFVGSTTHSGTSPDSQHQANIQTAYNYAKKLWPTLCK